MGHTAGVSVHTCVTIGIVHPHIFHNYFVLHDPNQCVWGLMMIIHIVPALLPTLTAVADVTSPYHGSETLWVNGRMVRSKCLDMGSRKPSCTNNSCMYGKVHCAVDHGFICKCKQHTDLLSSSICSRCLLIVRHVNMGMINRGLQPEKCLYFNELSSYIM